jgi:choline dehydrogenase-like flavoprotein
MGGGPVGRFLRLHPTTAVMGIYPQTTYPLAGIPLTAMCDEFVRSRPHDYGFWLEVPALGPGLAAVSLPGVGHRHRVAMQQLGHTVPFIALTRDGADLDASNGRVVVDRAGRTRIAYQLGPTDQQTMRESLVAAGHLHLENGATHAYTLHQAPTILRSRADLDALRNASCAPNALTISSAHVNGTCRMGTDPRTAGATPQGERYGARGVYIADGSLLPTAPGVNPQETVMALASLVADHIVTASA